MDISELSRVSISRLSTDNVTRFEAVNESIEEYLVRTLGPKHLPLAVVLPITIIYVIIFVSGVAGNVAVCVVIARNKSMRTATNYYLFSLAVSDLTLLLLGEFLTFVQLLQCSRRSYKQHVNQVAALSHQPNCFRLHIFPGRPIRWCSFGGRGEGKLQRNSLIPRACTSIDGLGFIKIIKKQTDLNHLQYLYHR
jgi:hypothetical protein